uniref:Ovule protein n=1 Tax=Panagrellus redivivus TaxID=6233 RepID=A0A7E4UMD2_PANRE
MNACKYHVALRTAREWSVVGQLSQFNTRIPSPNSPWVLIPDVSHLFHRPIHIHIQIAKMFSMFIISIFHINTFKRKKHLNTYPRVNQ